jgi:hypothetical protein
MLEIGTSGLMSGGRKRVGQCQHRAFPRLYKLLKTKDCTSGHPSRTQEIIENKGREPKSRKPLYLQH